MSRGLGAMRYFTPRDESDDPAHGLRVSALGQKALVRAIIALLVVTATALPVGACAGIPHAVPYRFPGSATAGGGNGG